MSEYVPAYYQPILVAWFEEVPTLEDREFLGPEYFGCSCLDGNCEPDDPCQCSCGLYNRECRYAL